MRSKINVSGTKSPDAIDSAAFRVLFYCLVLRVINLQWIGEPTLSFQLAFVLGSSLPEPAVPKNIIRRLLN